MFGQRAHRQAEFTAFVSESSRYLSRTGTNPGAGSGVASVLRRPESQTWLKHRRYTDCCRRDDLTELTTAFQDQFGFPLVVSAVDVDRYEKVIAHGWTRLANSVAAEKASGPIEVAKIFNHRFNEKVADANPIAAARVRIAAEYGH